MPAAGHPSGLLLAVTLGVAAAAPRSPVLAQTPTPRDVVREEVIVTAMRDAALTARVEKALREDPNLFADHMSVTTENGIVRLQGIALDLSDLRRALVLARRITGGRHLVNEIELVYGGDQ